MRVSIGLLAVLALAVLVGCPSTVQVRETQREDVQEPPPPEPDTQGQDEEPEPVVHVPEDVSAPDGPACASTGECSDGLACRGPRGCQSAWACGAPADCSGERVAYCDCDGSSFYAPAGCPGRPYLHVGACETLGPLASADELGIHAYDEPPTSEDRTCDSDSDCRGGERCFGPPGCGMTWRCERLRGCSGPRVELCGCDGATFRARAQCPGQPYQRRGACETAVASLEPGHTSGGASTTSTGGTSTSSATGAASGGSSTTTASASGGQVAISTSSATSATGEQLCTSNRDCRRGQVCSGPPGCGMTWTCQRPATRCNPDTQVFCDCERNTFRASMNCPGQPFAHRGSCEIDRLLELSGAAIR